MVSRELTHVAVPVWIRGGACEAFLRALRDGAVVVEMLEAREMCCSVCADVGDVATIVD